MNRVWKIIGSIMLSTLSLFLSFHLLQPVACALDPSFSLLANRGIGKIAFVAIVIWHIVLLLIQQDRVFWRQFLQTNLLFFKSTRWLIPFFLLFMIFAFGHMCQLVSLWLAGYVIYTPVAITWGLAPKLLWGFIATFFLAWSEELIFRGTLYPYLAQAFSPLVSAFITSLIFMGAHDLTNPLRLVTVNWRLGLGLFLLGFLLNVIFIITKKLYTGMGAHAGLVFVKVALRRIPCLTYLPVLPFWLHVDLRQSLLVHVFFIFIILALLVRYRAKFSLNNNNVE